MFVNTCFSFSFVNCIMTGVGGKSRLNTYGRHVDVLLEDFDNDLLLLFLKGHVDKPIRLDI